MTDSNHSGRRNDWLNRRTLLKGAAAAAVPVGVTGIASADDWREITFTSAGDEVFEYWLEVSGEVKRGGTYQSDDWDEVGENTVHGKTSRSRSDSYLLSGEITNLEVSGPGEVLLDGEVIEGETVEMDEQEASGDLTKVAIVRLRDPESVEGPDDYVDYVFEVTGDLEKLEPDEDRRFARDDVVERDGRMRVEGTVGTGDDRFAYSGDLVEVDIPDAVELVTTQR